MSQEYRVTLDSYAGPLDLLLYLVKKEEVDIHDIPIKRILDQYMEHLKIISELDLDEAGDFLVMAATLMVIKSRMLLPSEDVDLTEEIDPRYELVQQLLEYKQVKDSTDVLADRAQAWARMFGRHDNHRPEPMPLDERPLEEISIFDLMAAFQRVLESVGRDVTAWSRKVRVDMRPVSHYADHLARRLRAERSMLFSEVLSSDDRQEVIGTFLALLLLLKRELVVCAQGGEGGAIRIIYQGDREKEPDLSGSGEEFA